MLSNLYAALRRLSAAPIAREDRNIRLLVFHTALFGIVNGGVLTFLPVLVTRLGAPGVVVSLVTSLPALVTILFAIPAGAMVSRWQDIVRLSARCFYMLRVAYVPIVLAAVLLDPAVAPIVIVVIWGLTAIPGTLGNTVFYDIVAGAVPPRRRAAVNGFRWALLFLVSAVSVSAFGQVLAVVPWPANYLLLFGICFVAGVLSTYLYSRLQIPQRAPELVVPGNRQPLRKRIEELIGPFRSGSGFATLSLVTIVLRVGIYLPTGVFTIFLVRNLQASDAWIGARMMVENAALTVGYFLWGRMAGRLSHWRMLILAGAGMGTAFLVASQATVETRWFLFITALLWGFFFAAVDISLFEWLLEVMPAGERPRYVAMNTLLMNLVMFAAPIAGAAIVERSSIPVALLAAAGSLFASALLTLGFSLRRKPKAAAAAP